MITSLKSLIIYGLTFALSLAFIYYAQIKMDNGKKRAFVLYSFVGILIPCILAGLRSETVGTDILVYAKTAFSTYKDTSLAYVLAADTTKTELGYNLLALISSKFSRELGGFLFLIEAFVITPVYIVLVKSRKENGTSICIGMFGFYCLFYGQSLSIMRQSIGTAMLFLAIYEFKTHRIRGVILGIIAFLFHNSVAIAAPIMIIISYLTSSRRNGIVRVFFLPGIAFLCAVAFAEWQNAFQWLIDAGIVSSRYSYYLAIINGQVNSKSFYSITLYNIAEVTLKLILAIVCALLYRKNKKIDCNDRTRQYTYHVLFSSVFSLAVMILMKTYYGYRLSMFLEYGLIFLIPIFVAEFSPVEKENVWTVSLRSFSLIMICVVYFLIVYIIGHLFGVVPFEFA